MSEFNLIEKYFTRPTPQADLGVGDDAALFRVAEGMQLAVSTDMLVVDTHFFANTAPYDIGWKALAVNISDLAAMGAQPKWATLAIALPEINGDYIDDKWLSEFSRGFFACADAFNVSLIGGDTTRGPLNISVTIMGVVPTGKALCRNGAQVGDDIWVSGTLGDAALALATLQNNYTLDKKWLEFEPDEFAKWLPALHRPQPRVELGLNLRGLANSAIDISDGLLSDLGHILNASNLGAAIYLAQLPVNFYMLNHLGEPAIQKMALAGGDDYELCFTAPAHAREKIDAISTELNLLISHIGNTHAGAGLTVLDENNQEIAVKKTGFDHFA